MFWAESGLVICEGRLVLSGRGFGGEGTDLDGYWFFLLLFWQIRLFGWRRFYGGSPWEWNFWAVVFR